MLSELNLARSVKALYEFRKFACGLDEDVEHIRLSDYNMASVK